jgi:hypothetical protein
LPEVPERGLQEQFLHHKQDNTVPTYKWQVHPEYDQEAVQLLYDTPHIPDLLRRLQVLPEHDPKPVSKSHRKRSSFDPPYKLLIHLAHD